MARHVPAAAGRRSAATVGRRVGLRCGGPLLAVPGLDLPAAEDVEPAVQERQVHDHDRDRQARPARAGCPAARSNQPMPARTSTASPTADRHEPDAARRSNPSASAESPAIAARIGVAQRSILCDQIARNALTGDATASGGRPSTGWPGCRGSRSAIGSGTAPGGRRSSGRSRPPPGRRRRSGPDREPRAAAGGPSRRGRARRGRREPGPRAARRSPPSASPPGSRVAGRAARSASTPPRCATCLVRSASSQASRPVAAPMRGIGERPRRARPGSPARSASRRP